MSPKLSKCTSVLIVNEVEPCVDFWVNRFGLEKTAEAPHEGKLGFAMLTNGSFEVMYQSLASAAADTHETKLSDSCLYIDCDDIDAVIAKLARRWWCRSALRSTARPKSSCANPAGIW